MTSGLSERTLWDANGPPSGRYDEWAGRANVVECECSARERTDVSHNMFEKKSMRGVRPVNRRVARGVSGHWVRECGRV